MNEIKLTVEEAEALADLFWKLHILERTFSPENRGVIQISSQTWHGLFAEPKRKLMRFHRLSEGR